MALIHEKIVALLEQRRLKKRDLARALGVSPQTATDICKGRSAITLPHLRNLVAFFRLRADYWIDDRKLTPDPGDHLETGTDLAGAPHEFARLSDPGRLLQRIRNLLANQQQDFLARNPDLTAEERSLLGLTEPPTIRHVETRHAETGIALLRTEGRPRSGDEATTA